MLLLLDGHSSPIKNLDVIDLAKTNGVIILCFPPHCTHRIQPLDVAFMKPLSHFYTETVMEWQRLGRKTTLKDVFKLFGRVWQRAAKIEQRSMVSKRLAFVLLIGTSLKTQTMLFFGETLPYLKQVCVLTNLNEIFFFLFKKIFVSL